MKSNQRPKTNDGFIIRRHRKYYVACCLDDVCISEATCFSIIDGRARFDRNNHLPVSYSLLYCNTQGYFIFARRKNAVRKAYNLLRRRIADIKRILKEKQAELKRLGEQL